MQPRVVTVTELDEYEQCPQRWYYHRVLGLQSLAPKGEQLNVGGAAHKLLETGLLLGKNQAASSIEAVVEEFGLSVDQRRSVAAIIIIGVPEWVWAMSNPQSETAIQAQFGVGVVTGHPDLWRVDNNGIHIVEFKTSSKRTDGELARTLSSYVKFGLQLRRYATILYHVARQPGSDFLQRWPLGAPVYYQYVVVDYRGRAAEGPLCALTAKEAAVIGEGMAATLWEMNNVPAAMRPGFLCDWCPYWAIDEVVLAGGDASDIIATQFEAEPKAGLDKAAAT